MLRVNGTFMADAINVKQTNGLISVAGVAGYFPAAAVNRIEVNGYGGNDVIRLNSETSGGQPILKPCVVNGGPATTRSSAATAMTALGDAGNDIISAGRADDLLGGAGVDHVRRGRKRSSHRRYGRQFVPGRPVRMSSRSSG